MLSRDNLEASLRSNNLHKHYPVRWTEFYRPWTALLKFPAVKYFFLLHRYECFNVKYATRRFHMKLHPGYE